MMQQTLQRLVPELPVLDIAQSKAFYCDQMDCALLSEYPDFLIMELEGLEFHLWLCTDRVIPESSSCYIRSMDIDACYERYQSASQVVMPLQMRPWGIKEFIIMDPSGNLLKFGSVAAS
jgi:hypothetical protein